MLKEHYADFVFPFLDKGVSVLCNTDAQLTSVTLTSMETVRLLDEKKRDISLHLGASRELNLFLQRITVSWRAK